MPKNAEVDAQRSVVERQVRIVGILHGAQIVGLSPLPLARLHMLAYFADVLSPVWNVPVIDGQVLKHIRPYFPPLQEDLDAMVASGVISPSKIQYAFENESWHLSANYELNPIFSTRIISAIESFPMQARQLTFVKEVVYAASVLGPEDLSRMSEFDATYSDRNVAYGGMLDISEEGGINRTSKVALRFGEILSLESELTMVEMINLYVGHLVRLMQVA